MKSFISLSLLISLVLMGCSKNNNVNTHHPTQDNLQSATDDNIINADKIKPGSFSDSDRLVSTFTDMLESATVGELYGAQEVMFGQISGITADSDRIYLLDSNKQHIRVFSQEGEYVTTLGGRGQGPGEFESARSMTMYNDEWLMVNNGYRIEVFQIEENEITFLKTIQFEKSFRSICTIGDVLFAHNGLELRNDDNLEEVSLNLIQAYSIPSFETLFSFGESYKSNNFVVVERMSTGDLSCNESSSTVIFTFDKMQVLHGYSARDGQVKWKSFIDGLHLSDIVEFNEGGRRGLTYRVPESNIMDRILPSVSYKNEFEILQVERRMLSHEENGSQVLTFVLNSSNGEAALLSYDIPRVLNVSENLIASVSEDYIISQLHQYRVGDE